jgi:crotonobetainyl-CoA:carnitine CoA-transferase CaiB-like acyl-CoA transferase
VSVAETLGVDPSDIKSSSPVLKKWFKERTRSEISALLSDKVPCAPVLTDRELIIDPNVMEREMIVEMPHPKGFTYRTIATGIKFSETPVAIEALPPLLGADSVDVLKRLGYTDAEIKQLIDEGVTQTDA